MLTDLAPEVGADLFDQALLAPTTDDGLYYWRLVVGEAKTHQILFSELLWECIQIADIALCSLRA